MSSEFEFGEGYSKDQLTKAPFEHYSKVYAEIDPAEASARSGLEFDSIDSTFVFTLMGEKYKATWPEFSIVGGNGETKEMPYESILIMRFIAEANFIPPTGEMIAYKEFPWGDVYDANFQGRVIRRFTFEFARDLPAFKKIIEGHQGLKPVLLSKSDLGYRIEFMSGLPIDILIWEADDEFPASVQILFDKNFAFAFTAEDVAVIGDILINSLKHMRG
jgi:hypothetical protein